MWPTTAPIFTVSPAWRKILSRPSSGAGSSKVLFSESMTATFSSFFTASPSDLSHSAIWTSVMDSPTLGMVNSMDMGLRRLLIWLYLDGGSDVADTVGIQREGDGFTDVVRRFNG